MKTTQRRLVWLGVALLAALAAIQLVPISRDNPAGGSELPMPPAVAAVVRSSCFDCHSNETRWPWYGHVAPASWLLVADVREGREHLNFSAAGALPPEKQRALRREIAEEVSEGRMPLRSYLLLHPSARLDSEEKRTLVEWGAGRD